MPDAIAGGVGLPDDGLPDDGLPDDGTTRVGVTAVLGSLQAANNTNKATPDRLANVRKFMDRRECVPISNRQAYRKLETRLVFG
jgi:hypothetical protein